jgi:uncharacterized membrane protein YfcA
MSCWIPACAGLRSGSQRFSRAIESERNGSNLRSVKHILRKVGIVTDLASYLLLSTAVFAGAFVSGLAGFAFSAVAGSILLHVLQPLEAVPLMMACSVGVQAATLLALRETVQWKGSLVLIFGGSLAMPIAVFLLQNADTRTFRTGFGILLAIYAGYTLFRPTLNYFRQMENQGRNALIGFGGGLIGGLTAMPGALPTIWCDMHGMPKTQQRGLVQPFIAAMQIFALGLMLSRNDLSSKVLIDFVVSLPPLAAGTTLGILMFRRINEVTFRRVILAMLFFSGLSLVM